MKKTNDWGADMFLIRVSIAYFISYPHHRDQISNSRDITDNSLFETGLDVSFSVEGLIGAVAKEIRPGDLINIIQLHSAPHNGGSWGASMVGERKKEGGVNFIKKKEMSTVTENSRIQQIFENCNDRRNRAANTRFVYEINV